MKYWHQKLIACWVLLAAYLDVPPVVEEAQQQQFGEEPTVITPMKEEVVAMETEEPAQASAPTPAPNMTGPTKTYVSPG